MKKLMFVIVLMAVPFGLSAQAQDVEPEDAIDVGLYYATGSEAVGVSVQALKKLAGGQIAFTAIGSFGEADNSGGIKSGVFLMEGGNLEIALLTGISAKFTTDDSPVNVASASGLYLTYDVKYLGNVFASWERQAAFDKDNSLEAKQIISLGISFPL